MEKIKNILMKSHFCLSWYRVLKSVMVAYLDSRFLYGKDDDKQYSKLNGKYFFVNRSRGKDSVLIVLAGYKPQLWNDVFGRVKKYIPKEVDVCVVVSGRDCEELKDLCVANDWSYLSTKRNCLTLAQNIAIHLHPQAHWIYKIDEDMFITKGCFENMRKAFGLADAAGCDVGFVSPLINVNGYGYMRILKKLGMEKIWQEKFGRLHIADRRIFEDSMTAEFMWGLGDVDRLNARFAAEPFNYSVCHYRYSIGCILFTREFWNDIGMFSVSRNWCDMGRDEEQMCAYCMLYCRSIVVCENAYVGHLAFGPQTKHMLEFHAAGKCK